MKKLQITPTNKALLYEHQQSFWFFVASGIGSMAVSTTIIYFAYESILSYPHDGQVAILTQLLGFLIFSGAIAFNAVLMVTTVKMHRKMKTLKRLLAGRGIKMLSKTQAQAMGHV